MLKKSSLVAAAIGVAGALAIGGQSLAQAATTTPLATTSSATTATSAAAGTPAAKFADTPVTGTAADKASAAVTAKDSAVTVMSVRKDPDGSYDVLGTKAGAYVMFDVSADFATVTQSTRGGRGGHGGGGARDTPVTGTEGSKASAAVTAKDSTVTVTSVRKDPDGSYDVLGTKAGANVMYDVSADLKTITLNTHTGGHVHVHGHGQAAATSTATTGA